MSSSRRTAFRGVVCRTLLLAVLLSTACAPAAAPPPTAAPPKPTEAPKPAAEATKPPAAAAQPTTAPAAPAKPAAPAVDRAKLEADAKAEGKLTWYTSADLPPAQALAKAFETKYGIPVEVVRSGSEVIISRYLKEIDSNIHTPDVIHTSDESNFLELKEKGLLAPWAIADEDKLDPKLRETLADPEQMYYTVRMSVIAMGYNTNLIPPAEAPKTWQDVTDQRYKGKIVHGHPNYSGAVVTGMVFLTEKLGWDWYESLAKLDPMIVQSVIDVTRTAAGGERAIALSALDYTFYQRKAEGAPIEAVYPTEGVPQVNSPQAVLKQAPHPNAARLFQDFSFSLEGQQLLVDQHKIISPRTDVKYSADRPGLDKLNPVAVDVRKLMSSRKTIQDRFADIFGV
jgi:iron(III) transport system substrate-binding protein